MFYFIWKIFLAIIEKNRVSFFALYNLVQALSRLKYKMQANMNVKYYSYLQCMYCISSPSVFLREENAGLAKESK